MILGKYEYDDPKNELHRRSVRNTYYKYYNCGGYALETFSWYVPYDYERDDLSIEEYMKNCVKTMLEKVDGLRILENIDSPIMENEYRIAFRLGLKCDFHYLKQDKQGHWWNKRGSGKIRQFPKKEVLAMTWFPDVYFNYSGPIVFMAKRRI